MFKYISIAAAFQFLVFTSFAMQPASIEPPKIAKKRTHEQMESFSKTQISERASLVVDEPSQRRAVASTVVRVEKTEEEVKEANGLSSPVFIYDAYTQRRGEPKMLEIICSKCRHHVMSYQKDGPGNLLRCYLDRIHSPRDLKEQQYHRFDVRKAAFLKCFECSSTIGVPMIYQFEDRPAYKMFKDKFYYL